MFQICSGYYSASQAKSLQRKPTLINTRSHKISKWVISIQKHWKQLYLKWSKWVIICNISKNKPIIFTNSQRIPLWKLFLRLFLTSYNLLRTILANFSLSFMNLLIPSLLKLLFWVCLISFLTKVSPSNSLSGVWMFVRSNNKTSLKMWDYWISYGKYNSS